MLFARLVHGLTPSNGSEIEMGKWSVPLPPTNIDPTDYDMWFVDKLNFKDGVEDGRDVTLKALGLSVVVGREFDEQR